MASNHNTDDLYLFFPQWEGAGKRNVYTGATLLQQILKERIPFTKIEVEGVEELHIEHDIIGYPHILQYAQQTHTLLRERNPHRIFPLGGDCSIDIVPISFLNQRYDGDLAVIWLDAHADANTPQSSPSKTFHGMALRALLGEGDPTLHTFSFSTLRPQQIFLAGVRDLDLPEQQYLAHEQVSLFSSDQLNADAHILVDAIKKQGFSHVYVHTDVDVLDPVSFPIIKQISDFPTPGGVHMQTLWNIHRSLTEHLSPVGWSLVEIVAAREESIPELEQLASYYAQDRK
jgi:arginase